MEEVENNKDNINHFENNNYKTSSEYQNNNIISSEGNLKQIHSNENMSKFQKFKKIVYKYTGKMAFWKNKNKKNTNENKESKIEKAKKLEQKSLDRQIKIYANEKFTKEYGSGLGFNFFI